MGIMFSHNISVYVGFTSEKMNSLYNIITNLFVQTISIYDPLQYLFLRFSNSHDLYTHTQIHTHLSLISSHAFHKAFQFTIVYLCFSA